MQQSDSTALYRTRWYGSRRVNNWILSFGRKTRRLSTTSFADNRLSFVSSTDDATGMLATSGSIRLPGKILLILSALLTKWLIALHIKAKAKEITDALDYLLHQQLLTVDKYLRCGKRQIEGYLKYVPDDIRNRVDRWGAANSKFKQSLIFDPFMHRLIARLVLIKNITFFLDKDLPFVKKIKKYEKRSLLSKHGLSQRNASIVSPFWHIAVWLFFSDSSIDRGTRDVISSLVIGRTAFTAKQFGKGHFWP